MVIPVLITGLCAQNVSYGSIVFVFQSQTRRLKLMILFLCAKVVNVNVDDYCKRAWLSALHWLSDIWNSVQCIVFLQRVACEENYYMCASAYLA